MIILLSLDLLWFGNVKCSAIHKMEIVFALTFLIDGSFVHQKIAGLNLVMRIDFMASMLMPLGTCLHLPNPQ